MVAVIKGVAKALSKHGIQFHIISSQIKEKKKSECLGCKGPIQLQLHFATRRFGDEAVQIREA